MAIYLAMSNSFYKLMIWNKKGLFRYRGQKLNQSVSIYIRMRVHFIEWG